MKKTVHLVQQKANVFYKIMESPIGTLLIETSKEALLSISFADKGLMVAIEPAPHPILDEVIVQLKEYFAGQRSRFDIPLKCKGSDFEKKVWQATCEIPYGKTRSYGELAESINNKKAYRAVGGALNKNPIPFIIPCHRILKSDGSLGGYAFGESLKSRLLELEGCCISLVK